MARHSRPALCGELEHRYRIEVSLLQRSEFEVLRFRWAGAGHHIGWPLAFAQPSGEPDLQFRGSASASAAAAAASAAASAATSGDADVSGWLGDPGDGRVPGSAAA